MEVSNTNNLSKLRLEPNSICPTQLYLLKLLNYSIIANSVLFVCLYVYVSIVIGIEVVWESDMRRLILGLRYNILLKNEGTYKISRRFLLSFLWCFLNN